MHLNRYQNKYTKLETVSSGLTWLTDSWAVDNFKTNSLCMIVSQ